MFQDSGALPPDPDHGFCPWSPAEGSAQTPLYYRIAFPCFAVMPYLQILATPLDGPTLQ